MKLAIFATLYFTSIAYAAVLPLTTVTAPARTEDTHAVIFPGTAQVIVGAKARTQITNGELMKRGQPLAKPVKLYDAVALAKRVDSPPAQASTVPGGGTVRRYQFLACASTIGSAPSFGTYEVSSTSLQQTANECAAQSQIDGPSANSPERFAISTGGAINCYTMATTYIAEACNSDNFALYELVI